MTDVSLGAVPLQKHLPKLIFVVIASNTPLECGQLEYAMTETKAIKSSKNSIASLGR